eukprot:c7767_g1_i1.p1 GENE.c7767_g1_i1~~c7767_g1_i1.p1  ORF type:complete len:613 (-),score=164.64 c7767_g1_i1:166-1962(-)
MPTIREIVKKRFIEECIRPARDKSGGYLIVVLDQRATRILSSCMRTIDITREGVSLIEKLSVTRKPFPDMYAAYFIAPTRESINFVCADFEGAKQKHPQYRGIHLFLTGPLAPELESRINEVFVKTKKIMTWVEMNLDFLVPESQAVSFDLEQPLGIYSTSNTLNVSNMKEKTVAGIVSLLLTLQDFPMIRYAAETPRAKDIAFQVQTRIQELKRQSSSLFKSTTQPATLLVLDRGHDAIAPLLHEFSYQAMVYDVLEFKGNTFELMGSSGKRHVLLDDQEEMWPELRHLHISDAMDILLKKFNAFRQVHDETRMKAQNVNNLTDMREAVGSMPVLQSLKETFDAHLEITRQCMNKYESMYLESLAEVEQDLATGKDKVGNTPKNLKARVKSLLTLPNIGSMDKLRLLMLYIATQGSQDRDELCRDAGVEIEAHQPLLHLAELGVTFKKERQSKSWIEKIRATRKKEAGEPSFELSRYVPNLQALLDQLLDDKLPKDKYPAVVEMATAPAPTPISTETGTSHRTRGVVATWQSGKPKEKDAPKDLGPRIIVFVIGGATYSELRLAYGVGQKKERDVILASSSFLRPREFVEGLKTMDK